MSHKHASRWLTVILLTIALLGCASKTAIDPHDPYENYNRKMFAFNEGVDKVVLKPLATIYRGVLPYVVRRGISNVYSNVQEISSIVGHLLQGNPRKALHSSWRLVINSTFGMGGLFDIASRSNIKKDHTDFGVTFAKWGDKDSPYLVLPLLGPSTIRDTVGFAYDFTLFRPSIFINSTAIRWTITGVRFISLRAEILNIEKIMDEIALDRYLLQRNAYLQFRNNRIRKSYGEEDVDIFVDGDDDTFIEEGDEKEKSTTDQ